MAHEFFTHRRTVLPFLAKKIKATNYLEIGVKGGKTFLPIRVRKKYAVDPNFTIKPAYRKSQIWKYPFNVFNKYFPCSSDEFFENHCNKHIKKNSLDLAFIDGLHTYEQTYKDIENTLPLLKDGGVILLHDCSPKSAAAAFKANSIEEVKSIKPKGFTGLWSGDVWKVIPRLQLDYPQLTVFVVDYDSGLGIISKSQVFQNNKKPEFNHPAYSAQDISELTYEDLNNNRKNILKIIDTNYLLLHCNLFRS